MVDCCKLVSNFPTTADGLISVSSRGGTGFQFYTDNDSNAVTIEPSIGTVSISAYAATFVHTGCSGKATVSINWIRRADCNTFIYLFGGQGRSNITGDVSGLAYFPSLSMVVNPIAEYETVDASAASGPASLYAEGIQEDGVGLVYRGLPWFIDTNDESTCKINLTSYGIGGYGVCLLQSLSLQCVPGKVPTVNFDFIYNIDN